MIKNNLLNDLIENLRKNNEVKNEQLKDIKKMKAVLFMGKGKDGESKYVTDKMRSWAESRGLKIIFEAPAKYDDEDCATHYCKMLDHPIYPELRDYITGGISYGMIVLGTPEQLREFKRSIGKAVNPAADTLRGIMFAETGRTEDKNFVHCSDVDELDLDGKPLAMKEISNFKNVAEKTKNLGLGL